MGPFEFRGDLSGDMAGTEYSFELYMGYAPMSVGDDHTDVNVSILLDHLGTLTTLASTSFTVNNYIGSPWSNYVLYSTTVPGLDPSALAGDHLILRVAPQGPANLILGYGTTRPSRILVPGYTGDFPSVLSPGESMFDPFFWVLRLLGVFS
jgi:hypothetical protein